MPMVEFPQEGRDWSQMRLSKHHGLRNDFLVVLDEVNDQPVAAGPEMARLLCDRRSGVGADGLIHGARPDADSDVDVVMHLWNADGSAAEMSGNGIRCLAQAVVRARDLSSGTVVAATDAGTRVLELSEGAFPEESTVRVDMGPVGPGPGTGGLALPFIAKEIGTADLGNPHLVAWVDAPDSIDLAVVGPAVEGQFPDGINLEVIAPAVAPDALTLRVWERCAGITEACGTGACAAAALARRWGLTDHAVRVEMPGGAVLVELVDDRAVLTGPAVHIADLEVSRG
jgi:diaminopimelate epimerase